MTRILFILAVALLAGIGFAAPAAAQGYGGFEVCTGNDPKCQASGTVGLLCMPNDASFSDQSIWRTSADAMRVNGGQWEIWGQGGSSGNCPFLLVYHGLQSQSWGGLRYCAGDDPACQGAGQVAFACFFSQEAVYQPSEWHYTGDSIQAANGQWEVYYAANRQRYGCAVVLVGSVPYGGFGQLRMCNGNDASCQGSNAMPLLCDINGDSFGDPTTSDYTGRDIRVAGGQWQIRYPDGSLYGCSQVIIAVAGGGAPGGINNPPGNIPTAPPAGQPSAGALPSGSVIYFDGTSCPSGWARLAIVNRPNTPFHGMSICRRQ